jgi:hypothetical protein
MLNVRYSPPQGERREYIKSRRSPRFWTRHSLCSYWKSVQKAVMAKPKVIRRRTSNKSKAKSQQHRRRGDTLFRKAFEFSQECEADVMLVFRLRKNGQVYIFNSNDRWFPSRDDLVGGVLSLELLRLC